MPQIECGSEEAVLHGQGRDGMWSGAALHDCQWLQTLHRHGLLRGSFRPGDAIVRLRALHRQRVNFVEQRTRCVRWMQKALDQMNVQVHRAVTDMTGETGMAILRAIVAGERDPLRLASLRRRGCGKSQEQSAEHLRGHWRSEHLFNLESALRIDDALQELIAAYDRQLLEHIQALQPPERQEEPVPQHPNPAKERSLRRRGQQDMRETLWRFSAADLTRIDGISAGAALTILTELGFNLAAFPTEKHFVSWLRLCPRTPISGGRPLKKRRHALGANRVAAVLRLAAVSVQRSRTALGAQYRRIARIKGAPVAVFAIARKLAQSVYRMLRFGQDCVDSGEPLYEALGSVRRLARLQAAASSLGYQLTPSDPHAPAPSSQG